MATKKKEEEKRFRFPKGIHRVNFPFLLEPITPWQEQVREAVSRMQRLYGTNKRAEWGYIIENGSALVYITKYV
jgi:hypothetical protein